MKLTPEARMRANASAWLAEAGFPPTPVLDAPPTESDRCFLGCSPAAVAWADLVMDPWNFAISWQDHIVGGAAPIRGWRESITEGKRQYRWAAQLLYYQNPVTEQEFFGLDFDSHSPNQGLIYAIGHIFGDYLYQKLFHKKTNPFQVARARDWV